jgi:2-phospho-L-lactate guanylyltransferase (CobY/MobA/RfbA family)
VQPAVPSADPDRRPVGVVVPVRTLEGGKSRLGAVLDPEERRELVIQLLHRVLRAASAVPGVLEMLVVSPDREVLAIAASAGATPVTQTSRGLNPALVEARTRVTALLDPPGVLDPAFGGGSREGHAWLARTAGVPYVEVTGRPGLEHDLDMPEDLLLAEALRGEEPSTADEARHGG